MPLKLVELIVALTVELPTRIAVALATIVGIPEPIEIAPTEIEALSWNAIVPRSPFVGI